MQTIRRLGLSEATELVELAISESRALGIPMCIAVTDESGNLITFVREDGAKPTSISIAIDKAFTAAGARNHTTFYSRVSKPGAPAWGIAGSNTGRFSVIGGGVHIIENNTVVGGLGVSGGTAEQDQNIAVAAMAAFTVRYPSLTTVDPFE